MPAHNFKRLEGSWPGPARLAAWRGMSRQGGYGGRGQVCPTSLLTSSLLRLLDSKLAGNSYGHDNSTPQHEDSA